MNKNCRVQFDLKETAVDRIDRLIELSETGTRKSYVEYSLALMEWALTNAQQGLTIAAIDDKKGTFRELVMPPISAVKELHRGSPIPHG